MKQLYNFLLFTFICFVVYIIFRNMNFPFKEGMENNKNVKSSSNGIAGNASSYAAELKTSVIKSQDELLISKYRTDYETAILNLDDLLSNLMLKTTLSVNENNIDSSIEKLVKMQQAKSALNSVMKFVDTH